MMEALPTTLPVAALWNQFAVPLRSFVAKRAPRELDAEDLLQDVFLRIQEQLPTVRHAERIDAWIFQIARNVVADAFRKRARRETLADPSTIEEPAPVTDEGERAAEVGLSSCLSWMIEQLPEPYRQAIELTEIGGMTQTAAARAVGISISGMKSRVQRGRGHLKTNIIPEFCRVETDIRGGIIECDPLRPSRCSNDSMDMTNENEAKATETTNDEQAASTGCCGGAAPKGSSACCALDAEVKATGGSGCGCAGKAAASAKKGCC
ncbi:MAG TPA: sigma-70 family RNA polymerase sigma factor [Polyangiaceae bacterium]